MAIPTLGNPSLNLAQAALILCYEASLVSISSCAGVRRTFPGAVPKMPRHAVPADSGLESCWSQALNSTDLLPKLKVVLPEQARARHAHTNHGCIVLRLWEAAAGMAFGAQREIDVLFEYLESALVQIGHLREGRDKCAWNSSQRHPEARSQARTATHMRTHVHSQTYAHTGTHAMAHRRDDLLQQRAGYERAASHVQAHAT